MADARLARLLGKMTTLGTESVDKHLTAQIYGAPGVGKTVLAAALAQAITATDKSIVYADTREGYVSLENFPTLMEGVIRVPVEEFADLPTLAELIRQGQVNAGTVIIDEFSTVADMVLDELWRVDVGARPGVIPTEAVDAKLYKPMADTLLRLLTEFQRAGVHLIITAHERQDRDHRGVTITSPGYSPKLSLGIQKLLHLSARYTAEIAKANPSAEAKYERKVQSHPSYLVSAKSRIGGMPFQTDPTTWIDHLSQWLDSTESPVDEGNELHVDALPTEGVPVADFDGEPVTVDE